MHTRLNLHPGIASQIGNGEGQDEGIVGFIGQQSRNLTSMREATDLILWQCIKALPGFLNQIVV